MSGGIMAFLFNEAIERTWHLEYLWNLESEPPRDVGAISPGSFVNVNGHTATVAGNWTSAVISAANGLRGVSAAGALNYCTIRLDLSEILDNYQVWE